MKMKRITVLGIVGTAALLAALCFLPRAVDQSRWYTNFELSANGFDTEVMKEIQRSSGLILPDGARGVRFAYKPPIDPAFLAVIEIPIPGRDSLLRQIEHMNGRPIPSIGGLDGKMSWWKPAEGEVIIDRASSDGRTLRAVLTRNGEKLLLFLDYST